MPRNRLFAGVLAVFVLAGALFLTSGAAVAGPITTQAVAGPTSQAQGARTLAVSESSGLPASGASITVTGTGYDPAVDVYLAICRADIQPADDLTYCIGGVIPTENTSAAWALVTSNSAGKKNTTPFGDGGSFKVDLKVDAAVGSSVDCVTEGCVLISRSAGVAASRAADVTIPLKFAAPATSTSDVPDIVSPDSVALPEARVGDQQTVVFTGYSPGEDVVVTVFSDSFDVPGIKATNGGVVTIVFQVPDALLVGQHTVQAIGAVSHLVGVANFAVVAPVVPSSSAPSSDSSVSSSASESATSTAPTATSSAEVSSVPATTTSASAAAPVTPASSGSNLWWLWATLALLVVVAGITAAVVLQRRKAQELEQERLDRERELPAVAAANPAPRVFPPDQPWTGSYNDPSQSHGLLSGHQGDGPALYSGQGSYPPSQPVPPRYEPPTTRIPTPPPVQPDPPTTAIPPVEAPPNTERWSPFGEDDDDDQAGPPPPRR